MRLLAMRVETESALKQHKLNDVTCGQCWHTRWPSGVDQKGLVAGSSMETTWLHVTAVSTIAAMAMAHCNHSWIKGAARVTSRLCATEAADELGWTSTADEPEHSPPRALRWEVSRPRPENNSKHTGNAGALDVAWKMSAVPISGSAKWACCSAWIAWAVKLQTP